MPRGRSVAYVHGAAVSLDVGGPELTNHYIARRWPRWRSSRTTCGLSPPPAMPCSIGGSWQRIRVTCANAEQHLRDVVEHQRALARESGREYPFACWPLMAWGAVAHAQGSVAWPWSAIRPRSIMPCDSTRRDAVRMAWAGWRASWRRPGDGKKPRGCSAPLRPSARSWDSPSPKRSGRWLGLSDYRSPGREQKTSPGKQRAFARRCSSVLPAPLPPLPDPTRRAELWTAGRSVPIEDAIAAALAVDLATPLAAPPWR